MANRADPLVGRLLGNYRLDRKLGQGSCGVVYRSLHVKLGTPFAVKILHPILANNEESAERFLREAQTAARIGHENVVFIADFDIEPEIGPYFVMEYLEGKNLREVLAQESPLSTERLASISEQMCHALAAAHRAGVVHRDLKPANISILPRSARELVKILDFGIAKITSGASQNLRELTRMGRILGTPRYFSPEQAQGLEIDHRSDIYSFGIILYEMLTGKPPFDGTTPEEMILLHMAGDAPPLDENRFPSELQDLVDWLLAKKPDERPDDMEEVWALLKESLPLVRKVTLPAEELRETQKIQGFTGSLQRPEDPNSPVQRTTGYVESAAVADLPGIERTIPLGTELSDLKSAGPSRASTRVNFLDEDLDFAQAFTEEVSATPPPKEEEVWISDMLSADEADVLDDDTRKQRLPSMLPQKTTDPAFDLPDIDDVEDDDTRKQRLPSMLPQSSGENTEGDYVAPSSDQITAFSPSSDQLMAAYSSVVDHESAATHIASPLRPAHPREPLGHSTLPNADTTPHNVYNDEYSVDYDAVEPVETHTLSANVADLPDDYAAALRDDSNTRDFSPPMTPNHASDPLSHTLSNQNHELDTSSPDEPHNAPPPPTQGIALSFQPELPSQPFFDDGNPGATVQSKLSDHPELAPDLDDALSGPSAVRPSEQASWHASLRLTPVLQRWDKLSPQQQKFGLAGAGGTLLLLLLWWMFSSSSPNPAPVRRTMKFSSPIICSVKIYTSPPGADLWLADRLIGSTRGGFVFKGSCDKNVTLSFRHRGYFSTSHRFHLEGTDQEVTIPLRRFVPRKVVPKRRRIRIQMRTRPSRVSVYLHGRFLCRTPCWISAPHFSHRTYVLARRRYNKRRVRVRFDRGRKMFVRLYRRRR